jgi:hypothetical protein
MPIGEEMYDKDYLPQPLMKNTIETADIIGNLRKVFSMKFQDENPSTPIADWPTPGAFVNDYSTTSLQIMTFPYDVPRSISIRMRRCHQQRQKRDCLYDRVQQTSIGRVSRPLRIPISLSSKVAQMGSEHLRTPSSQRAERRLAFKES